MTGKNGATMFVKIIDDQLNVKIQSEDGLSTRSFVSGGIYEVSEATGKQLLEAHLAVEIEKLELEEA